MARLTLAIIGIACRRPGFRRAGMAHPAYAEYPAERIDAAALEILRAEPMLQVTELPGDPAGALSGDAGDETSSMGDAASDPAGGEALAASAPESPAASRDGDAAPAQAEQPAPEPAAEVAASAASAPPAPAKKKAKG